MERGHVVSDPDPRGPSWPCLGPHVGLRVYPQPLAESSSNVSHHGGRRPATKVEGGTGDARPGPPSGIQPALHLPSQRPRKGAGRRHPDRRAGGRERMRKAVEGRESPVAASGSGRWAGCHLPARTWPEDVRPPRERPGLCVGGWPLGQSAQKNLMTSCPVRWPLGDWGGAGSCDRLILFETMRPSPSPPPSCLLLGGHLYSRQKPHLGSPLPGETARTLNLLFFSLLTVVKYVTQDAGFPRGSVVKNPPANAGDGGSIPGSGRSPGGGNGNPLQDSCLGNTMDGGAWRATVHRVAKSWT